MQIRFSYIAPILAIETLIKNDYECACGINGTLVEIIAVVRMVA